MTERAYPPSPLEQAVLAKFHEIHREIRFPSPDLIQIVRRTATPCGRYVELSCASEMPEPDGYLDLQGKFIEMPTLTNGMLAIAKIEARKLVELEFTTYGGESWDGSEDVFSFR